MKVADLKPDDMLDLEPLGLPGTTGIAAQCELAVVESVDLEAGRIYTDLVNLTVDADADLVEAVENTTTARAFKFADPARVRTWTW